MPKEFTTIFLSSTVKDFDGFRKAILDSLAKADPFHCDAMENFGLRDSAPLAECRQRVIDADLYIGVFGHYRGWEVEGDEKQRSITEIEYDCAVEYGKPRFICVAPDDHPIAQNLIGSEEVRARQKTFLERVKNDRVVSLDFSTPEKLADDVTTALFNHAWAERTAGEAINPDAQGADTEEIEEQLFEALQAVQNAEGVRPVALPNITPEEVERRIEALAKKHEEAHSEQGRLAARLYRHLGALAFLHNTQKALEAYSKAVSLDPDDPDGWNELGHLQNRLGNLKAAEKSYKKVLSLGNSIKDKSVVAVATGNLGLILLTRGDLDGAEDMHRKSLALSEELGHKEGMANQYGNIGLILQGRDDVVGAEEMHRKSLAIEEELGRKEGMANQYGNIGLILKTRGDLDGAEEMHRKSLAIEEELGRKEGMASEYGNIGLILRIRGDLDGAEEMHRKSLTLSEELGSKEGLANQYGNLGNLYKQRQDISLACKHWMKARDLFAEIGMPHMVEKVEKLMREAKCEGV